MERGEPGCATIAVMVPERASHLLPPGRGHQLLAAQIDADVAHVAAAVSQAELASPLCCLALVYVSDDETPSVSSVYGWTQEARDEAFAADPEAALETLWSVSGWDVDLDELVEPPSPSAATGELRDLLLRAGCEDPAGAYLQDLASRLNRSGLPGATTTDFACWATEHEMSDEPWRAMAAVALPEVVEHYRTKGWLRLPDE